MRRFGSERRLLSIALALAVATVAAVAVLASVPDRAPRATSVVAIGPFQRALGCVEGDGRCPASTLALVDGGPRFAASSGFAARRFLTWTRRTVWRGKLELPPGRHAIRVLADGVAWGEGARRDGPPVVLALDTPRVVTVLWDEDARVLGVEGARPIVTVVGSFQTHLGCARNGEPDCVRGWLHDPDGDGAATLSTQLLPAGTYEARAFVDGREATAAPVTFRVEADHAPTTFAWDLARRRLQVGPSRGSEQRD